MASACSSSTRTAPDATTGNNIFIASSERGKETVTSAQSGRLATVQGERFLVLDHGHRLETETASGETRVSEFAEYGNRIDARIAGAAARDTPRLQSTLTLLRQPTRTHRGELSWRLGLALAAINCVIIALAATRVNPRVGRSAGLVFALFAFASYYNLLTVGESWIRNGRIGFVPYVLLLHGGIFLLAMGWLLARHGDWLIRWRRRPTRREPAT